MTSITDCRQAIQLVLDSELDWRIIIHDRKAVRGVLVFYGDERIVLDRQLRVEGNCWVCRERRFTPAERAALTDWALAVISKHGAKRSSRKKLKPRSSTSTKRGRKRKKISRWEILYADPNENSAPQAPSARWRSSPAGLYS